MLPNRPRELTGSTVLVVVGLAGFLTWLCVGWFGDQPPLTAFVAVLLVQLLLAGTGVIAVLLTERLTITLLDAEKRTPVSPKRRSNPAPLWRRLPESTTVTGNAPERRDLAEADLLTFRPVADDASVPAEPLDRAA